MGGQTYEWMDMQYMCIDMQKNNDFPIDFAIFTKALQTNQPTDQTTDQQTDQQMDIPSYRDAVAASKNICGALVLGSQE